VVQAGKIPGGMARKSKVEGRQKHFSNHTFFTLRKRPFGAQRSILIYENARANMKDNMQYDSEIRIQEDNITANISPRSTLTFRNLLFVVSYV